VGLALTAAVPANAQTGNFQDNNSLTGSYPTTSTTREIVGQTFTAQATGKLKSITVWVGGNSNGGYMNLTVENVTGGVPNGVGQHTFGILLGSASTSEQVFYLQGSDGGLDVVAGQVYAFSWYAYGGTKLVETSIGNAYSGGSMFQGIDNSFPQGYQAAFTDQDFRFVTSIDSTVVTNPTVTGTPASAILGSAYSFAYLLGGTPIASKTRISSGALPPGLSISNGGVISGTPTATGTYTFTVEVDNGAYATINSSILVRSNLPDAPAIASASAGYKQATVTFTSPAYTGSSAITGYTVTTTSGSFSCTAVATDTSCAVTGLTAGNLYRFTVTASNSSGTGASSAQSTLIQPYSEPGSPSPVSSDLGDEQITVNWGPASNNGGSISTYTVTLSPGGQTCTVGLGTYACTFTGLTNGVAYTPSVYATSNRGIGSTNIGAATTPGALPSAPTLFSATAGNQSAALSWALPADNGGYAPTGYQLRHRADASEPWTIIALGAVYSYTVTGLDPDDDSEFQIAAITSFGGPGAFATASATPYGPPAAPTSVTVNPTNGQLGIAWSAPHDFGAAISGYAVQYKETTSAVWLAGPTTTSLSAAISGLTNGVSYDVQVSAANLAGYGPWSGTAVGTPLTTATAPQLFQTIPGDQSVILNWASPADLGGSAVISYLVSYRSGVTWTDVQTTQLTTTFTGLDNGVAYDVRVAAITAAGLGAFATSSVTPYGVPEIVVITPTRGDSEVALSWTAAAPNGSAVIAYELQYKLGTDSIWTTPPTPTALSATVTGLTNGVSYDFRVRAYNQGGAGPFAVVSATPSTVPGVPQGFTAIGGDESITVDWDPPLDDGGSPITSYDVEYKDAFGWVDAAGATTFTGLTNSLLHDVHVRAVNAVGPGPWAILGVTPYQFEPTFSVPAGTTLKAGDTVTVSGDEALPGETVAIELQSAPIHLGSTVVAADGSYSLTVTIPSTAVAGAHHLVATLGGSLGTAQLAVGVLRPSGLAGTGVDPVVPFGSAVLLLLAGGLLFWRSRRGLRTPR
jgi:titin